MTKQQIELKIEYNRDTIQRILNSNLPIKIISDMVKAISKHNEKLIEKLGS